MELTETIQKTEVEVIPATRRSLQNSEMWRTQPRLKVAAYCRVSTGDESQQTSYTNQKAFYTMLIQNKEGWEFAGIYADEAISGTSRAGRKEFNRMIDDAKQGKFDYIVTKSISRFARNTVDTLNCVRELRQQEPPVGIYFEKENINTLDAAGELILTILSALAQDESRSISDNIRWTFQKNFRAGIPQINLKRMIGYDKGPDGTWMINPEQAPIVRYIFKRYVCGQSARKIAAELNAKGCRTVNGKTWTSGAVMTVLRNEKYVGDLEMQKTITKDFLTHRSVMNCGEAPRYYVKNHHIGIVDRTTWDKVQAILCRMPEESTDQNHAYRADRKKGSRKPLFSNLRCGAALSETGEICGERLRRMTYTAVACGYSDERSLDAEGGDHSRYLEKYTYAFPIWRCRRKIRQRNITDTCPSEILHECAIEQSFMELLYRLKRDYEVNGSESRLHVLFRNAQEQKDCEKKDESLIKNFEFFLQCLSKLPEKDATGRRLQINGLDKAPHLDYLVFEKGIYASCIKGGIIRGDTIEYDTAFGIHLITTGNRRTPKDFFGFRRIREDGSEEILDTGYQVYGSRVQYRRYPRKKEKEKKE